MGAVKAWMMEQAENRGMMTCPECWGEGKVEVEYAVPHNINRDVGIWIRGSRIVIIAEVLVR